MNDFVVHLYLTVGYVGLDCGGGFGNGSVVVNITRSGVGVALSIDKNSSCLNASFTIISSNPENVLFHFDMVGNVGCVGDSMGGGVDMPVGFGGVPSAFGSVLFVIDDTCFDSFTSYE